MPWGDRVSGTGSSPAPLMPTKSGGWGSAVAPANSPTPSSSPGGGGILGAIKSAGHFIAEKSELAGRDIKGMGIGAVDVGKLEGQALAHDFHQAIHHPLQTQSLSSFVRGGNNPASQKLGQVESGTVKASAASIEHPLRDPFQTLLTALPLASGAAGIAARAGEAAGAARAGEGALGAAKALVRKPVMPARSLKVGPNETPVPLIPSNSALGRAGQAVYDKVLQHGLTENPAGPVAAHAMKRVSGASAEEARIVGRMNASPAAVLNKAAGKLSKMKGARREEQAALELTSHQVTPAEAVSYHTTQAEKGVNPTQNTAVAKLYQRVADRNLVHLDETKPAGEKVFINPEHVKLANADAALARVQSSGDQILAEKGVRTPEVLQERVNNPGKVRAGGAVYEKPTPGKMGVPSQALVKARTNVDRIGAAVDRAEQRMIEKGTTEQRLGPAFGGTEDPRLVKLKAAHSVAKDDLQRLEDAAANRVKPTGIVGGETARPGRGFMSDRVSEKKFNKADMAASRAPVLGETKAPIDSKTWEGRALQLGLRPKHVAASASRHFQQIVKFVNTDARRRQALALGSDAKRTPRDILVRNPDVPAEKFSAQVQQALGREKLTVDTADELATEEGLRAAHDIFRESVFRPGELRGGFAKDKAAGIGTTAPDGYKWVDRNAVRDILTPPKGPRNFIAKSVDNVNSAVTAATVYFKVGHIGTRVFTNAATNMIQGSLNKGDISKSYNLWHGLSDEEKARALAAAGQHGFAALPHEGSSKVSRIAGWGANQWARHADAPFRFNSIAYEARRIGYNTPEKFKAFLDHLQSGGQGLPAHEWSKVSAAARRADREAISYDRLNDPEKRYLTRAVWFYPWIKGSTLFTVRTALEHPYKAGALAATGVHGRKVQAQTLGPTPSYEAGLTALTGGSHPWTTDLSTFSPFATSSDVIGAPVQPGALAGFLNPALGSGNQFINGLNQYGGASKSPYFDALLALGAPTPEQQIAEAYAARGQDQSNRMFPKSTLSSLYRFLGGPSTPRQVNPAALNKAAQRERSGQR